MTENEFDIVVIGSGPGGYVAAIRAAQLGFRTACVEKRETLGGTCLNVGCIPSKALLQSSEHIEFLQKDAKKHGIDCAGAVIHFDQMMHRKDEVVESLVSGVAGLFKKNKIQSFFGTAGFSSSNEIEISAKDGKIKVKAKNFILATGSDSIELPFLKFDEKIVLSSTGALSLEKIPKKLMVIGAGVIGVELASVYKRLGSEIAIIEMLDIICPAMDGAVSKMLLKILKQQGMNFHLGAQVTEAKVQKDGVVLKVKTKDGPQEFQGDAVLVSIGRRPYTEGLGLEEIGVKSTKKGFVEVDLNFRTTQPHIYAIGDIIDGPMLAHRASEEGTAVAELIAGMAPHINYAAIPNVIYTHPEVAAVGLTEEEAKQMGLKTKTGTCLFKGNARARCSGYTEGMVKIIAEETSSRIIGLHIIGPHASEMICEGVIAIEKHCTLLDIANASHAHPTLCESIKEASLQALGRAIHL
jgi:dihydrolipoamide dehydrogenase